MKLSTRLRISAVLSFLLSGIAAYAQTKSTVIELTPLIQVIGVALTLGGVWNGYQQMVTAKKIAEVEAKFNSTVSTLRTDLTQIVHTEIKGIEAKMVTRHDLNNLETIMKLRHDFVVNQLEQVKSNREK